MDVNAWFVTTIALFLLSHYCFLSNAGAASNGNLDTIRKVLVRQEDTIIFCLIERAKFSLNSKTYVQDHHPSLAELFVAQSESLQAKFGRYENPEEIPFFPEHGHQQHPIVPPYNLSNVVVPLHPAGSTVNVSSQIWEFYINKLLPLLTASQPKDDGNYASSLSSDLTCLQALAKRIHYGRFVAEVKFRASPNQYTAAIRAKDERTLDGLLTDAKVEEMVKQRVANKAMVFGQDVTLNGTLQESNKLATYKVNPALVSQVYNDWVIPLTKVVELQYLLRRLD